MLPLHHNPQPIPTGMYWVLSISSSPPFPWMTTFQQHIPQKCWYTPGCLYPVTVQIIIIKTQNVISISNMTLNMCLHGLTVHMYEQSKGYKRTLQQFWYCQCQALQLRTVLFWVITQRVEVISYPHFRTTYPW